MTYHQLVYQAQLLLQKNQRNTQVAFELLYGLDDEVKDFYSFSNNRLKLVDLSLECKYFELLNEFINEKPLERILGYGYFCGRRFYVDENVFAFRVETELLVDVINKIIKQSTHQIKSVIDVCCGSGVLGLSVKMNFNNLDVSLLDISLDAISNSKKNAQYHNIEGINYLHKSMQKYFLHTKKRFDLIICNPPYIKSDYQLDKQVLDYDPLNALVDFEHKDGISFYLFIINNISLICNKKFTIVFEIGYDQKTILENVLKKNEFPIFYYFINDYNNLYRILVISNIKYENL
ncbi:HemK/PrmC family methyltransferase [Ureaplasma urealyticum]|uniref:HemK/PrmC family methyltransferase n=1 Tax=Ureaplasma urealyticum TaxID=2130 RepID=UPI000169D539|nr:HemK/PrmC family methyltransferase [Ureaplasma urealyticum]EDX54126.1 methyltransferase, HemK family [Ureaplasma urealyticum serovar 9 str. ATCC 33175]EDT49657.1 methyltransferase, HemK family [Ureaplasma urealyticum serovar 13 str. ATCC 33698]EDX53287.1 methyltransferase, HemK family [Ureaplasma urealyticum serovar 12 str. ATCC 33696]EDY74762.1 methyltransferase, HemK family [Ureaplasma urealyticum serovar 4 str. ATCC 27816]EEH02233.1 methyltransferase, HemK family [Ureaplasma urealyticum 